MRAAIPSIAAISTAALVMIGLGLVFAGCARSEAPAPGFQPIGGVKQTMAVVLEPAAEKIWDSAGFIITEAGEENLAPTTDEEWAEVVHGAAVVAESANLLLMPGRVIPADDWIEISRRLGEAGRTAMAAAEAQDAVALFDAGGDLYQVCVSCHQLYWQEGASRVDN